MTVSVAPAIAWVVPIVNSVAVYLVPFEIPDDKKPVPPLNSTVVPLLVCAVEITGSLVAPAVVGLVLSAAQPEPPHHLVALIGQLVLKPTWA
jgi:hypothetical protein